VARWYVDSSATPAEPAVEVARAAGEAAQASYANREALEQYNQALGMAERAIILCDGALISAEHLPLPGTGNGRGRTTGGVTGQSLGDVERQLVENALKDARNNKAQAARLLGITRAQLYSRLQKYGIA